MNPAERIAALERELQKRDAQVQEMAREAAALEARVNAALHDLDAARQHLALVEAKLNILEGAANVLDTRLRTGPGSVADASR
jgi:chromosome segregation ATPase